MCMCASKRKPRSWPHRDDVQVAKNCTWKSDGIEIATVPGAVRQQQPALPRTRIQRGTTFTAQPNTGQVMLSPEAMAVLSSRLQIPRVIARTTQLNMARCVHNAFFPVFTTIWAMNSNRHSASMTDALSSAGNHALKSRARNRRIKAPTFLYTRISSMPPEAHLRLVTKKVRERFLAQDETKIDEGRRAAACARFKCAPSLTASPRVLIAQKSPASHLLSLQSFFLRFMENKATSAAIRSTRP